MAIEEIIQQLPKEYQEIARRYIALLVDMGFEELQAWVELLRKGDWLKSYEALVAKMSTEEVLAEEKKGQEILKQLNKDNADRMEAQFTLIEQIILTSILMLRKEIEE